MNQSTANPTRKVTAGGLAGAVTVILVWVVQEAFAIEIPGEVASAITVVLSFAAAYMTQERPGSVVE